MIGLQSPLPGEGRGPAAMRRVAARFAGPSKPLQLDPGLRRGGALL